MSLKIARSLPTLVVLAACALFAAPAAAAPSVVGGAADGRLLLGLDGRYGGALSVDLWYAPGRFKVGGAFATAALSAGGGSSSRVLSPIGLSLAFEPARDESGLTLIGRGGVAPGARKGGFSVGSWASCALGYRFALGEGASVRVGAEAWGLWGPGSGVFFAPYLGLGF